MLDYRHLDAYRQTRALVVALCATVAGDSDRSAPEHPLCPLRHAAVAAALAIADSCFGPAGLPLPHRLDDAAGLLEQAGTLLAEAVERAELEPADADRLAALQRAAVEALTVLQGHAAGGGGTPSGLPADDEPGSTGPFTVH